MAESWRAQIEQRGVNPFVRVSAARAQRIRAGVRRPIPVRFQLNGRPEPPARVNLVPGGGGAYLLYLNGIVRKASSTAVGDRVVVSVEFDASYRAGPTHPMPPLFRRGLAGHEAARRHWEEFPPSLQKEFLRYFAALRSDEARRRNIERALAVLDGEEGRFLGRGWKRGRPVPAP
jgi:hypothetical protein